MAPAILEAPSGSVLERFASIQPDSFRSTIDNLWQGVEAVKETVCDQVETGRIPVLAGLGIVACAAGQAFAYQQMHGETNSVDMLSALSTQRHQ